MLNSFVRVQKVDATYLLSGWSKGEPAKHVVKVVRGSCLEKEKDGLSRIDALHVYSVQTKAYRGGNALYEADMGPVEGEVGRPLGRVVMVVAPVRTKSEAPVVAKRAEAPSQTQKKSLPTTSKAAQGKRKVQTIESDDEDDAAPPPEVTAKKYKTYINDKGEEVTEVENVKETLKVAEKKGTEGKPAESKGSKPSGKAIKQKGIASFFSKKK